MEVLKQEDIIAWEVVSDVEQLGNMIYCSSCHTGAEGDRPLTTEDFVQGDGVFCDICDRRIY